MAAGRYTSAAISTGCLPSFLRYFASLAQVVVLPEPCRPAMRITVGGLPPKASFESPEPIRVVSSSLTIFTTCCAGVRLSMTSAPRARSLTCADELAHDLEVDVGLEQRKTDLAHRCVDVLVAQLAAALEAGERVLQTVTQRFEHGWSRYPRGTERSS